mmetsp:Transcript_51341/g.109173  ORF Transcript_51341/g.109173 Transcript_51341/m.109173 type:complete len:206 (+) Transcript_51341:2134-2751(+)
MARAPNGGVFVVGVVTAVGIGGIGLVGVGGTVVIAGVANVGRFGSATVGGAILVGVALVVVGFATASNSLDHTLRVSKGHMYGGRWCGRLLDLHAKCRSQDLHCSPRRALWSRQFPIVLVFIVVDDILVTGAPPEVDNFFLLQRQRLRPGSNTVHIASVDIVCLEVRKRVAVAVVHGEVQNLYNCRNCGLLRLLLLLFLRGEYRI